MSEGFWRVPNSAGLPTLTVAELAAEVKPLVQEFCGARLILAAGESYPQGGIGKIIPWDAVTYDTHGVYDTSAPTRATIPPGFRFAEFLVDYQTDGWNSGDNYQVVALMKNGAFFTRHAHRSAGSVSYLYQLPVAALPVIAGDYFEAHVFSNVSRSLTTLSSFSVRLYR